MQEVEVKRYARKRIYHGCLVGTEKSVLRDHCLASRIFLSAPIRIVSSEPRISKPYKPLLTGPTAWRRSYKTKGFSHFQDILALMLNLNITTEIVL